MELNVFWSKLFAKNSKKESPKENKKTVTRKTESKESSINEGAIKEVEVPLSFLKKLQPICLLADLDLKAVKVLIQEFDMGQVVYEQGEPLAYVAYVVEGEVYCENKVGAHYEVVARTFKALYPLSNSPENLFTAIAKTAAKVIYLPKELLLESSSKQKGNNIEQQGVAEKLQNSSFGRELLGALKASALEVPSLPDVAIRLRVAVQKEIGAAEAVTIVKLDQGIAAKLVQVVNSPLYRGVNPLTSCDAAVNRLGLISTRNLVTSFSMRSMFKSKNKQLSKRLHEAWLQSIRVSSLCHALAVLTHKVDPEEALLAGLTHNIGLLPIISLADQQKNISLDDVDECSKLAQAFIGQYVLNDWGFADEISEIPYLLGNWFYESGKEFGLIDIVILAKYHSFLGSKQISMLPALHDLPAFQKLGDQSLTPDLSLQILHDAQQQISESMALFEV